MALNLTPPPIVEEWFDYPEEAGVRVRVRHVPQSETNTYIAGMVTFGSIVSVAAQGEFILHTRMSAITGWEGIENDGKPAPLTDAFKRMFLGDTGRAAFIQECINKISEKAAKEEPEAEKNS